MEYIPYGEVFVEERNNSFSTNYLFNAKELDNETGLYYYGARYLDPTGAMWLSVDPMWENRSGISPFNYCLSNPIKMIDPDGMWEQDADGNWIAQKNDNAYTLAKALNVNPSDAIQMMKDQGFEFTEGDKKVNLQIGEKFISGNGTNENANKFSDEAIEAYRSNFGGYPVEKGLENVYPELLPFGLVKAPIKATFNFFKEIFKSKKVDDDLIFGNNPNQVYHTFRHVERESGLSPTVVERSVRRHFRTIKERIVPNQPNNFVITVEGKQLQYTVFKLKNGKYNVGRIHEVRVTTP